MASKIAKLYAEIGVDTNPLKRGLDSAKSALSTFGSSLSRVAEIAGGTLLAGGLSSMAGGLKSVASEALTSYRSYEQLSMSMEALMAREIKRSSIQEKMVQVGTQAVGWTEKESDEYNKLATNLATYMAKLPVMRENLQKGISSRKLSAAAIYLERTEIVQLEAKMAETEARMAELGAKGNQLAPILQKVTTGGMSMADAMGQAGPKAKELLGWIQKLAIESPFQMEDIANALKLQMSFGYTAEEAKKLTSSLVDFVSATGGTKEQMQSVALSLGQIKSAGKITGMELRELSMAGVPIREYLAKGLGVTTAALEDMVSKGAVPAQKVFDILTKSLDEDFGGAAKRTAGTFNGLISSLADLKDIGLREFFAGTFKAVQPLLQDITSALSSPEMMDSLRAWGENIGKTITEIIGKVRGVVDILSNLWSGTQVGQAKGRNMLFAMLGDMLSPEAINTIQGVLTGNFEMISQNIAGLLTQIWEKNIKPAASGLWNQITTWLFGGETFGTGKGGAELGQKTGGMLANAFASMMQWVDDNKEQLATIGMKIMEGITSAVIELTAFVANLLAALLKAIVDNYPKAVEIGAVIGKAMLEGIGNALGKWIPNMNPFTQTGVPAEASAGVPGAGEYAVPEYQTGGYVPRTGLAYLHGGERVLTPAQQRITNNTRGGDTFTFNVNDSKAAAMFSQLIRQQRQATAAARMG